MEKQSPEKKPEREKKPKIENDIPAADLTEL